MKKLKITTLLILLLCVVFQATAQDNLLKKANKCFLHFDYPEAAEYYKKVLARNDDTPEAKIKLAEAYRLMNMPIEAEYWYEQVVQLPESEPIHWYYYGQALKANGKFEDAKQAFMQYAQLVPADTRGLRQVEACDQANYFLTDPGIYNVKITNVNSGRADFGPAFYKEGIVFASEEDSKDPEYNWREQPFLDLFYSPQSGDNCASLGNKEEFKGKVNTWVHEGTVSFTNDFGVMYFTRNNYYKGKIGYDTEEEVPTVNLELYEARALNDDKWGDIRPFPYNSDDYSVGHPALSADEQVLYFISDMPGGYGETDIYVSYRSGDSWGTPENLGPEINTEGREMFPFISKDNTLYFSSDALPGLGGLDVFTASLLGDGTWSQPENLRYPINTNGDDFSFIIDENNEQGYFASNRPGGSGDDDIYCFSKLTSIMTGRVVLCSDPDETVEGAEVELYENNQLMQRRKSGRNGAFSFPISPGKEYRVVASKDGYEPGEQEVSTFNINGSEVVVQVCLGQEGGDGDNDEFCYVMGRIYDEESNAGVAGAVVKLKNSETNEEETFVTGSDGVYEFQLNPESTYVLYATKESYFTASKPISTIGRDCRDNLLENLKLDIALSPQPSADLSPENPTVINNTPAPPTYVPFKEPVTIIDDGQVHKQYPNLPVINHIYYDFDESYIRDDAKPELEKIVQFMMENPNLVVELGSHTDSRGTHEYNQGLSERRAIAAREYLIGRGIREDRLTYQGYGETQPVNECVDGVKCPDHKHQDNRRTEFKIIGYYSGPMYSNPRYHYETDPHKRRNYYKDGIGYGGLGESGSSRSYSGGTTSYSGGTSYGVSSGTTTTYGNHSNGTYYDTGQTYSNGANSSYGVSGGSSYSTGGSSYSTGGSSSNYSGDRSTNGFGWDPNCCVTPMGTRSSRSTINNGHGSLKMSTDFGTSSSSSSVMGTEYKIQLGIYRTPDMNKFSGLGDLGSVSTEVSPNGGQRVIMGTFFDQKQAQDILYQVKGRGFSDAFIVTYKNGLRVGR